MKRRIIVEIDLDKTKANRTPGDDDGERLLGKVADQIDLTLYRFFEGEEGYGVRLEET